MSNRLVIPLLCAASAVAFASGTTNHKTLAVSGAKTHSKSTLTSTFTVKAGQSVEFRLDVRNNTNRMLELRYPTGKTHDFIVQDAAGKEVWRWSKDRMFTSGIQNKLVKAKSVAAFSENWKAENTHGKFTAVALLTSDNHPIEERVEFELK